MHVPMPLCARQLVLAHGAASLEGGKTVRLGDEPGVGMKAVWQYDRGWDVDSCLVVHGGLEAS